jgi:UDP-3-O-[3-hydroxymyristoyl] glucosamine N-acyltransferase
VRASAIAKLVAGELEGGADPGITGVAPLDRAGPADLSFLASPKYLKLTGSTAAGLLLVSRALAERCVGITPRVIVDDVHRALARILPALYPEAAPEPGIHPLADVAADASLGEDITVGPYAVIGAAAVLGARVRVGAHVVIGTACDVGDDVVLHAHVTLYPRVRIGARSILHSGVRVGVDGYGYAFADGVHHKVPQVGECVIGEDVEIGANTTIDRGSVGATEIGNGVKIDNLVHIAHNVRIGEHSLIIAQVGIAGSTTVGSYVTLAGQAGIPGHVTIGDRATIAAQAGVFGDVPAGETYSGYPARPHRESLRAQAGVARLPGLVKRVAELERTLEGMRTNTDTRPDAMAGTADEAGSENAGEVNE